ncbi:hypothetical protein BO71DRAFT_401659 [Aspergillus ellipticus CBS 707.79]|uniref:Uncharacterized protein n=1 Tax=Aspergillus ellipticus CBS 707.79 TaxID=1448320 RepID=A0A319DIV2_9EURO|nr:hypothetical protein BO71DRAFT_401659 [Aspergillus ellipticus CBS 707.79]
MKPIKQIENSSPPDYKALYLRAEEEKKLAEEEHQREAELRKQAKEYRQQAEQERDQERE